MKSNTHHADTTLSSPTSEQSILLVGNAPYRNRGCEAIVRGTMEILEKAFGPELRTQAGVMASPTVVSDQQSNESDRRISNFSVSYVGARGTLKWWLAQSNKRLNTAFRHHVRDLIGRVDGVKFALQIGGDNYSLEYGRPWDYMAIDKFLQNSNIPIILWGASVGPFDQDPTFAPKILSHLKTLDAIFVRETASQNYLAEHGVVDNVHLVSDPAFVMRSSEPEDQRIRDLVTPGSIGINISPLVAKFSQAGGDLDTWRRSASEMITAAAAATERPILLIPHVGSPYADGDDFSFLESVRQNVVKSLNVPIKIIPEGLNAAEIKWLISRCDVFAGARTHSTIAALSSHVPTLSLSYSVKAVGINQDIFGHQRYCHSVKSITPKQFAELLKQLVEDQSAIRSILDVKIPEIKERAFLAGTLLADRLRKGDNQLST